MNMYIASCDDNGGLYHYTIDNEGNINLIEKYALKNPMYMCIEDNKMHVLLRDPFGNKNSGIFTYTIGENGELTNPTEMSDTGGVVGCHVSSVGDRIFCANYISGNVSSLNRKVVEHIGKLGPNEKRQDKAHAHQMCVTPNKKFVCGIDLGIDAVIVYDLDLNEVSRANVPAGYGARHGVFTKDGKTLFVINELTSHISVFSFDPYSGKCEYIKSFATNDGDGFAAAAAIRLTSDEKLLYASERGDGTIIRFDVDGTELKNMKKFDCGGVFPRDFDLTPDGKFMVVTNEKTNNVAIFKVTESGDIEKFTSLEDIIDPLCVVFCPEKNL